MVEQIQRLFDEQICSQALVNGVRQGLVVHFERCDEFLGKDDENYALSVLLYETLIKIGNMVLIVATSSQSKDELHPVWRSLDFSLEVPENQTYLQREILLKYFTKGAFSDDWYCAASIGSGGLRACDLHELSCKVSKKALEEGSPENKDQTLSMIQEIQRSIPKDGIKVRLLESITWDQVFGQSEAKDALMQASKAIMDPNIRNSYHNREVLPPRGIILHGPPGTGKTLLARALATQCRAHFLLLSIPNLVHAEVGSSEKALRSAFDEAITMQPSIIFMDEFESLVGKLGGLEGHDDLDSVSSGSVTEKISSQLIAEFDRLAAIPNAAVLVLAATNFVTSIPKSLRRFGRFDAEILVSALDNDEQISMANFLISQIPSNLRSPDLLSDLVQKIRKLDTLTTGAQITQFFEDAKQSFVNRMGQAPSKETHVEPSLELRLSITDFNFF